MSISNFQCIDAGDNVVMAGLVDSHVSPMSNQKSNQNASHVSRFVSSLLEMRRFFVNKRREKKTLESDGRILIDE